MCTVIDISIVYPDQHATCKSLRKSSVSRLTLFDEANVFNHIRELSSPRYAGRLAVIIAAHIDHVGSVFESGYFPGALDGASGVGMMLELARVMKQ